MERKVVRALLRQNALRFRPVFRAEDLPQPQFRISAESRHLAVADGIGMSGGLFRRVTRAHCSIRLTARRVNARAAAQCRGWPRDYSRSSTVISKLG